MIKCHGCGKKFKDELDFEIHKCKADRDLSHLSNEDLIKEIERRKKS
jgi:hypothetical protein